MTCNEYYDSCYQLKCKYWDHEITLEECDNAIIKNLEKTLIDDPGNAYHICFENTANYIIETLMGDGEFDEPLTHLFKVARMEAEVFKKLGFHDQAHRIESDIKTAKEML